MDELIRDTDDQKALSSPAGEGTGNETEGDGFNGDKNEGPAAEVGAISAPCAEGGSE